MYDAFSMLFNVVIFKEFGTENKWEGEGGMEDTLTLTYWITRQATKEENQLLRKERFSLFNTGILNLYCKLYWAL